MPFFLHLFQSQAPLLKKILLPFSLQFFSAQNTHSFRISHPTRTLFQHNPRSMGFLILRLCIYFMQTAVGVLLVIAKIWHLAYASSGSHTLPIEATLSALLVIPPLLGSNLCLSCSTKPCGICSETLQTECPFSPSIGRDLE